jgi:hypothetical protein
MADIDAQGLAQYRRDGFIIVESLLDDLTRRRMKQVLAELIEGARAVSTHDDVYDLEPTHSAAQPRVRRIKKPHLVHPVFAEFMRSPRLLAVLSALLGPSGVRLHGSKLNLKAPEIGSPVGMAPGLGLLSAHQRRPAGRGRAARRCHRPERSDDGAAGQPPRPHLRPPRLGRPVLRRHGAGARRARLSACPALDRPRGVLLVPPCAGGARLGARTRRRTRATCCSTSSPQADAFPLLGIPDWDDFNARLLVGEPTVVPRSVDCPIRMPLPPAANQGSIYENQTALQRRYFEPAPAAVPRQST